ncbi:MAG: pilus assembly protein N-terminal domain-containing protein [Candidatus Zixiibacteriota bacterium]
MKYHGTILKRSLCQSTLLALLALSHVGAQTQPSPQVLRIVKGKSAVVTFPERIKTMSIADQEVIDVVSITPTDAVVIGKAEGTTSLYIWGESGRYLAYETKVDRAVRSQQVVLEVQMAELNRTKFSDIGFDLLMRDTDPDHIASGEKTIGSYAGEVTIPDPPVRNIFAQEEVTGIIKWIGNQQTVQLAIRALQENGIIRLLANPRLVCLSEEEASFLVGGEIPVPVPTQAIAGGAMSIAIQWKEFGIKLAFRPEIVDSNLVRLKIAPEVSSLDYSNTVTFAGWDIPAIRTRRAAGTVELNSSQSVVLGGLTATETLSIERKVPLLGQIPILGALFTKKQKTTSENELLIVVTPRIIETVASEIIPPLPGLSEEES